MSLQYYIDYKKYCTQYLYELQKKYDTNSIDLLFFSKESEYLKGVKEMCEQKIHKLCNHEFERDLIDIDPDRSKIIEYCKICEYVKK